MSEFQRKLNRLERLKALAEAEGNNWWKELLDKWQLPGTEAGTDGLRLAIRDNYLNFYRRGQSVARVSFDSSGSPCASVHLKYLGCRDVAKGKEYARLKNGAFSASGRSDVPYVLGVTLPAIIGQSENWTSREKFMVDLVVAQTQSVVDLEIGLPRLPGSDDGAPRMDLAALEEDQAGKTIKLVFWEAKTIDDDRLRATNPKDAKVHVQLGKYMDFMKIRNEYVNATRAYRENCRLLVQLAEMAGKAALLSPLVHRVAQGDDTFEIDATPRLVIFEGDSQQGREPCTVKRGANWEVYERCITTQWKTKFTAQDGYRLA